MTTEEEAMANFLRNYDPPPPETVPMPNPKRPDPKILQQILDDNDLDGVVVVDGESLIVEGDLTEEELQLIADKYQESQ
jgi:F420-dependent methylenetetrahydromethanopterin dehydrogenase